MTATIEERRTVDGIPVKLGDQVWFWRGYGSPRLRKLDKTDLGMWWASMTSKAIYSTERAALDAALEDERRALKKAKQQASTASLAIERLTKRRAEVSK